MANSLPSGSARPFPHGAATPAIATSNNLQAAISERAIITQQELRELQSLNREKKEIEAQYESRRAEILTKYRRKALVERGSLCLRVVDCVCRNLDAGSLERV